MLDEIDKNEHRSAISELPLVRRDEATWGASYCISVLYIRFRDKEFDDVTIGSDAP